jgi:hypothetical protein
VLRSAWLLVRVLVFFDASVRSFEYLAPFPLKKFTMVSYFTLIELICQEANEFYICISMQNFMYENSAQYFLVFSDGYEADNF